MQHKAELKSRDCIQVDVDLRVADLNHKITGTFSIAPDSKNGQISMVDNNE